VRRSLRPSAGLTVLAGRAVAQAGFFAFTIGPALVLGDVQYNDLIIGVTVMMLAVVAPVAAFQQHLIRYPDITRSVRSARSQSLVLAAGCAVIGTAIAIGFGTPASLTLFLALGGLVSCLPSLAASLHALEARFTRSAVCDAVSGVLFVAAVLPLLVTGASSTVWAATFAGVWMLAAAATSFGPLAITTSATESPLGPMRQVLLDARAMIGIGVVAMAFNRADYLALSVVGVASQTTRYAIATRVVGPILIALGSLNNSLYVQQIKLRAESASLSALTERASRRVGTLAVLIVPVPVVGIAVLGLLSDTFASMSLILPTAILALATVPFAFAIPYGFGFNAIGRERTWLSIISVATVADLAAVLVIGHRGAVATASLWLITQLFVWLTVIQMWRSPRAAG